MHPNGIDKRSFNFKIKDMSEIDSMIETIEQLTKENEQLKLRLSSVSCSYSYEIDFGTHCRAGIDITNNEPKVIGAMNGWGYGINLGDIKIKKL